MRAHQKAVFFILVTSCLGLPHADADPSWWSSGTPPVIDGAALANNHAVANIGQAKWIASEALRALRSASPATADAIQAELTSVRANPQDPLNPLPPLLSFSVPDPKTEAWVSTQKAPLLVGQLKAIAAPFYDQLHQMAPAWVEAQLNANLTKDANDASNYYPWTSATTDDLNKGAVNIGQLKAVFALDFSSLPTSSNNFVSLPINDETLQREDGVPIAFNLAALNLTGSDLPSRIDISVRSYGSNDPWVQVGRVTDFTIRNGVKFVRGSTVWIPDGVGVYEIKSVAYNTLGNVISSVERKVTVQANHAPSIVITGGPDLSDIPDNGVTPIFQTSVLDEDPGDSVKRVEFYDRGVYLGTDSIYPFGDGIDFYYLDNNLYSGEHHIKAKAFDRYGKSTVSEEYDLVVPGSVTRPTLTISSPATGSTVSATENLNIQVSTQPTGGAPINALYATNMDNALMEIKDDSPFNSIVFPSAFLVPGYNTIAVACMDGNYNLSYWSLLRVYKDTSNSSFTQNLVNDISDNSSVVISNPKYHGQQEAAGIFSNALGVGLQMDSGILLSTGKFEDWDKFSNSDASTEWSCEGDTALRDRFVLAQTYDAVTLEFDAVCSYSQLEFEFQFGSEEYPYSVGGIANDAIMVSIDGMLLPLTPDGLDTISINSVNSGNGLEPATRSEIYMEPSEFSQMSSSMRELSYNAGSIKMKFHAFVKPNVSHHVKVVCADAYDDMKDSGIFIQSGSLRSVNPAN